MFSWVSPGETPLLPKKMSQDLQYLLNEEIGNDLSIIPLLTNMFLS